MSSNINSSIWDIRLGIIICCGVLALSGVGFAAIRYYRDVQTYDILSLLFTFDSHSLESEFRSVKDFLLTISVSRYNAESNRTKARLSRRSPSSAKLSPKTIIFEPLSSAQSPPLRPQNRVVLLLFFTNVVP